MNSNPETGFLEFVHDFYATMKTHKIKLVYEGKITSKITKAFIALAEAQMQENEVASKVQRTVFHVMVECLQNVSRHADEYGSGESIYSGKGIFLISNTDKAYCITTGNAIANEKISSLKEMLEYVNALDEENLKDVYLRQMREGRLSSKGGAGWVFIELGRKTEKKLASTFLPLSKKIHFSC